MTHYRLLQDFHSHPGHPVIVEPLAKAGQLLFPWRAHQPKLSGDVVAVSTTPSGWGQMLQVPRDQLEANPPALASDFAQLLDFYLDAGAILPNLELGTAETLEADLQTISYGSQLSMTGRRIMLPHDTPGADDHAKRSSWAKAFVFYTQGGQLDGRGVLLINKPGWNGNHPAEFPRTARFKLCDHQLVVGAGARPQRGWHPGRCSKCQLDMTVDSGD